MDLGQFSGDTEETGTPTEPRAANVARPTHPTALSQMYLDVGRRDVAVVLDETNDYGGGMAEVGQCMPENRKF